MEKLQEVVCALRRDCHSQNEDVYKRQVLIGETYKVELNSPKLEYGEMEKLQEVVRSLRRAGGIVNDSCGMVKVVAKPAPVVKDHVNTWNLTVPASGKSVIDHTVEASAPEDMRLIYGR